MVVKRWTKQEEELLLKIHSLYSSKELAEMFEISVPALNAKKRRLNIGASQLREKFPEGMRRCNTCHELLPLETNFCLRSKKEPNGRRFHTCKGCTSTKKALIHRASQLQKREEQ